MTLKGKGFFIWKVPNAEGGNAAQIANAAQAAKYTHVLIKIADGNYPMNIDKTRGVDLVPPVVTALRSKNIQAWGWHYVYGGDPLGESRAAINRLRELNLDGYVIDAEIEYKNPGRATAAKTFMNEMRKAFPNLPMALSSFRFPSYHPQLPWKEFLERCDYNMPQVYWELSHNPAAQLNRCVKEFQALSVFRPIIPTGPAYKAGGWAPSEADTLEFLNTVKTLNLPACNFFSWDECRRDLPKIWNVIQNYPWEGVEPPKDIAEVLVESWNKRDPDLVTSHYYPDAVHITATRTIQGMAAIRAWYQQVFTQLLPGATFKLTGLSGTGTSRHFTWTATSTNGKVQNGNDTLGLLDQKIAYHYSHFTITA